VKRLAIEGLIKAVGWHGDAASLQRESEPLVQLDDQSGLSMTAPAVMGDELIVVGGVAKGSGR
jgi:hypothetical protein